MSHTPKTLPHYRVEVARATGDWLTAPEYLGEVDREAHLRQQETAEVIYDTYEHSDDAMPATITLWALTVVWKDDTVPPAGPRRPAPASIAAVASAIAGQPDSRRWHVGGANYSTAEMLAANAKAPDVIAWISTARAGDIFRGSFLDCTCLG